jgi:hypothetical protein
LANLKTKNLLKLPLQQLQITEFIAFLLRAGFAEEVLAALAEV